VVIIFAARFNFYVDKFNLIKLTAIVSSYKLMFYKLCICYRGVELAERVTSVTRFFSVCSYLRANYLVLSVQNNFSFCVHFLFLFVLIELLFHNNYDIIFVMYQIKYYLIICARSAQLHLVWPALRKREYCSAWVRTKICDFGGFCMLDFIF